MFLSPPNHNFLNSTFANSAKHQRLEKMPLLQMHPEDAARRHVEDGDAVVVWNDRGRIELTAKVSESMLPGTVISQGLWWDGNGKNSGRTRSRPIVCPTWETGQHSSRPLSK